MCYFLCDVRLTWRQLYVTILGTSEELYDTPSAHIENKVPCYYFSLISDLERRKISEK